MSITHSQPVSTLNWSRWTSWISDRFGQFQNWRRLRRQQRINRQAFQQLLYLDDHLLRDTGYHRADLEDANNLPLDVNAAQAVKLMKSERHLRTRN